MKASESLENVTSCGIRAAPICRPHSQNSSYRFGALACTADTIVQVTNLVVYMCDVISGVENTFQSNIRGNVRIAVHLRCRNIATN